MICSIILAGVLPHLFKFFGRRRRPDRSIRPAPIGIRLSGNAYDSFPSGHGCTLASAARLVSPSLRPFVWPVLSPLEQPEF